MSFDVLQYRVRRVFRSILSNIEFDLTGIAQNMLLRCIGTVGVTETVVGMA